jgi:hypothetical protein
MKILHRLPPIDPGSMLIVSLVAVAILSFVLASYLSITQRQSVAVARSQAWNAAIPIAESGVEEALAQLNRGVGAGALNLAANGWVEKSSGKYGPQQVRYLGSSFYDVAIVQGATPVIYSTGFVAAPYGAAPISRAIQVTTTSNAPLFSVAMVAKDKVDFKGFGTATDSFDSEDPNFSTNGRYDPAKARDKGDVASTFGLVNVGNAKIKGKLKTGPTGSSSLGPNGSVGSAAWVNGGNSGIEPGWSANNFNSDFPIVLAPFSSAFTPASGSVGGTNYNYVLGTDNYLMTSLSLKAKDIMYINGNAVLYVTGDVLMQGNGNTASQIIIGPGSSLSIYVGGASATFTQVNTQGSAKTFNYFGLPANASVSFGGNATFVGTIYCPNADFTIGGGGNNVYDFEGSVMSKTIKMNGHFKFHFDENLARSGPSFGYVVASWREL